MSDEFVNFDQQKYKTLKRLYTKAKKDNIKQFFFEGKEVLVDYAKYMLEYLESRGFK